MVVVVVVVRKTVDPQKASVVSGKTPCDVPIPVFHQTDKGQKRSQRPGRDAEKVFLGSPAAGETGASSIQHGSPRTSPLSGNEEGGGGGAPFPSPSRIDAEGTSQLGPKR